MKIYNKRLIKRIIGLTIVFLLLIFFSQSISIKNNTLSIKNNRVFAAVSQNEVEHKLNQLRAKFPNGTYWNHPYDGNNPDGVSNKPCTHHGNCDFYGNCACNSYSNAIQCHGFALKVGNELFGSNPGNWRKHKNWDELKIGDMIRYKEGSWWHSIIVISKNGDMITAVECNTDGHCIIRWYHQYSRSYIEARLIDGPGEPTYYATSDQVQNNDTTSPTIEKVWIDPHNHTELMLKVKASDSSGISEVRCNHKGAWRSERDWHLNYMVPQSNGEWHLMLRPDDGYGDYDIHLYVRDNAGNESFYATSTGFGTEGPTIKDCDVIDLDDTGFTISGEYSPGQASLEYFNIPVWTTDNGQDDLCEVAPDRIDGNKFYKRINFSEHKNERGPYNFHMYLRNKANLDGFSGINGYSPVYEAIKTIEKDGHIYALYDNALSWENAKKKAEEFGGHLATIKNQEEQTVVNKLIASGNKKGYWLGGYKDNQWKWITSEDFTYDNWASTQPDNAYNREDKLMVFKEGNYEIGEWNDASNEDYIKMGFIIEYEPQLDNAVFTETLNGHTYKVYPENLTWNEAKEKCENLGGHLITANTSEEQQLVEKITSNYGSNYWLGGKLDEANVWRWVTGEMIQSQYWAPGQPDHGQGEPYLGTCTDNGLWNDYGNVSDNIDGYILELEHTNAETAKSVIHNGKEYIRYDVGLPWNEAQQYCESQGGHLAIIRDEATQQAIAELIQGGRARYLLGASDAENEGDWKWLDGSALTYTHWGNDEPNNYEGNEDYLIMDSNGDWNDVILSYSGMSTVQGFICEVPYEPKVEQVTLDKSELILNVGDSRTLSAVVKPDNASDKKLKWDSSNTGIATVDQNGKVKAIVAGQAKVTATSVNGKQASCTVIVNPAVPANALQIKGNCDKTAVKPGDIVTITINLENYGISEEEISSMQIEIPNATNELSYIPDSKKLLLESGEFSTNENIIFAYLPLSAGDNVLPKDTEGLFTFQMKVKESLAEDMDAELPMIITMGNKDDESIMEGVVQNIIVPIRKIMIIKGDLNGKNGVDIMDARKAKRAAMKEVVLTDYELQAGDLNGDGVVTIIEARKIKRAAMKEIML